MPPSKGQWINERTGQLFHDRVIPVNIIATEDEMKKIATMTMKHYDQEAVMYFKLSEAAVILYREDMK